MARVVARKRDPQIVHAYLHVPTVSQALQTVLMQYEYSQSKAFRARALGVFGAVFVPVKAANAIGFTKQLKKADISEADYALSEPFLFRAESHFGVKYFDTQLGGGRETGNGEKSQWFTLLADIGVLPPFPLVKLVH